MTNKERWEYYESGELQRASAVDLLDWVGYWTAAGTSSMNALQSAQTDTAIKMILADLGDFNQKVAKLAISDATIKNAPKDGVTEEMIYAVVNSIMACKLEWLTGVKDTAS